MGLFFARRAWLVDTTERAVSTAAQSALAVIGTDVVGLLDVDLIAVASVAALGALGAVLKALAKGGRADGS